MTVGGHKMYAPKGIAALYIRAGADDDRFLSPNDCRTGEQSSPEAGTKAGNELAAADSRCHRALPF